jgi:hypothetical protein
LAFAAIGIGYPMIMFGVLVIRLGRNPIPGRTRVTGQGQVLFLHLLGGAADFNVGTVAFEAIPTAASATAGITFSAASGTRASIIGTLLFHVTLALLECLTIPANISPYNGPDRHNRLS